MPSAEQHLKDAWKHLDHAHAEHSPALVQGIENHAVDERTRQKRPFDAVYVVKCSCGEIVRIPVADVYEQTAPAEEAKAPEASSNK